MCETQKTIWLDVSGLGSQFVWQKVRLIDSLFLFYVEDSK